MSSTNDCSIPINVGPFILSKFRTGSYLIYDDPGGATNFRKGTDLADKPFRASGSHQLDVTRYVAALKTIPPTAQLYLVDLRQETHLFFDDGRDNRAVSWYADKDFANVGQTLDWIVADEAAQLAKIKAVPATQIYCITQDDQGNVSPTGYKDLVVKSAATEKDVAGQMPFTPRPNYIRIPVTDHCMPGTDELNRFIKLCVSVKDGDWVHCHCHGGDGRTTTFLALFDMVRWAKSRGTSGFPTLDDFAHRQCQLFNYCLNPNGCPPTGKCKSATGGAVTASVDWKYFLAVQRWWFLDLVRTWIVNGGLTGGNPFTLPKDWELRIATG
jgi:hypothetical protein